MFFSFVVGASAGIGACWLYMQQKAYIDGLLNKNNLL